MRFSSLFTPLLFAALIPLPARADTALVLPFFNLSKSPNLDWIGESIAENIRESLGAEGILVLNREDRQEAFRRLSVRPYALLTRASVVKLAEAVDASQVIFGQFDFTPAEAQALPTKGSLRITGRVIDLKLIKQGPELVELGALEDLAFLQTHLAWQVLRALAPDTSSTEQSFLKARPTLRVDAIESYIRGLLATSRDQKLRFFAQAARLDNRFSQPCFQLGRMHVDHKDFRLAIEWLERVARADSHYYEARFLLGLCRYYTADYARAEQAFAQVAEAVPVNEVINNLAAAQSRRNSPEAVSNFRKALEGDAADPDFHFNLGFALWKRAQFDDAAQSFRASLERKTDDPEATLMLGRCLQKSGPRPGDPKSDGLERIKLNFEETFYRQLKAALEVKK
ncbi:MAG: tetratricopeptide repeat protein [Bryobacteraceae bacterium]